MLRFELKHIGEFNYKTDPLTTSFGDQYHRTEALSATASARIQATSSLCP